MKRELSKLILVRALVVTLTVFILPLIPIAAVKIGFTSPEYLHRGILQSVPLVGTETGIIRTYIETTKGLMASSLGKSLATGQSVDWMLWESLTVTIPILILVLIVSLSVGLAIGVLATIRRTGIVILFALMVAACIPMVTVAYLMMEWLRDIASNTAVGTLSSAALLSLYPAYLVAKTTRATLENILISESAQFFRACGFSERYILFSQAPKAIFFRLLALTYPILLYGLSFSFFVESPFGISGFGQRFINAIHSLDYPVIIGFSLFGFLMLTVVELFLTLVQAGCDPRLRHG